MTRAELSAAHAAHVAVRSVLGARPESLLDGLAAPEVAAVGLARALCHPDRQVRAAALAAELGRLARQLPALGIDATTAGARA